MRIGALLFLLSGALVTVAGCGGSSSTSSRASLRLQREDLVAVSRALHGVENPVAREVAAAKVAWPLVHGGLRAQAASSTRPAITAAAERAAQINVPGLLKEPQAASLTGQASQLAGLFWSFSELASRGWGLMGADSDQIERGSPAAARFARENAALYIESVYDGHFSLAQIGKKLLAGYHKLGGPAAFGAALTQQEVDALARAYSEAADRLHPHVAARLGS